MGDNRNYVWSEAGIVPRPEYPFIVQWVTTGARVIDLGCGNGSLLRLLREKSVSEFGIEISASGVEICRQHGLNVRCGRIDVELTDCADEAFDYAVCNVTLQMVQYPEILLREMKRIAQRQIISFPNFAFAWNRLELLLLGRMPRKMLGGYSWYDTGHYHQFSIRDFRETVDELDLRIVAGEYISRAGAVSRLAPNLLAQTAIFMLEGRA